MKLIQTFIFLITANFVFAQVTNGLELQGILDLDLPQQGFTGKAIHLVAKSNIADLSAYGIGSANNGGGSNGEELTFPNISVNSGDNILLARDTNAMHLYLGNCFESFDVVLVAVGSGAVSQNGNDAIELFENGSVIETFGDINVDGTGTPWEYTDSWAYKDVNGSVTFSGNNWVFGPVGCTILSNSTFSSSCPYPFCTQTTFSNNLMNNDLFIYPNPFNSFIQTNIELNYVYVSDVSGRIIDLNFSNSQIFTDNLSNGIYTLYIKDQNKFYVKKIIKQ